MRKKGMRIINNLLKEYWNLSKELDDLKIEIEKITYRNKIADEVEESGRTLPFSLKMSSVLSFNDSDEKTSDKLENIVTILRKRYDRLLDLRIQVEKFIDEIPTSRLRTIFTMRYIKHYRWGRIASELSSNEKRILSEDSVRKEHDRYLKKIKKN